MTNKPVKKRNVQHRIDSQGLDIFSSSIPQTEKSSWVFTKEVDDYGIDGQIQVTENESHTGEFYKVQIKSKSKPKYSKDKKKVSVTLNIASAFFLIESIKSPTALIIVDVTKGIVFWVPIQTDSAIRASLFDSLDQKSLTLSTSTENVLSKDNYSDLLDYFRAAHQKLSQKSLLETEISFNKATSFISDFEKKTLKFEGYDYVFRRREDAPAKGVVFSVGYDNQKVIDYVPGVDFRPELLPRVTFTAAFSTTSSEGIKKSEQLMDLLKNSNGSVDLSSDFLKGLKIVSGNRVIENGDLNPEGYSITLSPHLNKQRERYLLRIGDEEFENEVEIWIENNKLNIKSLETQPVILEASILPGQNSESSMNIRINIKAMKNANHYLRYLNFFKRSENLNIYRFDDDKFTQHGFLAGFNPEQIVNPQNYEFIKDLATIETISGISVIFPEVGTPILNEIKNVRFLKELLETGKGFADSKVELLFKPGTKKQDIENVIEITQEMPLIKIFDKKYQLTDYEQKVRGSISKTELVKGKANAFSITLKNAEFQLYKRDKKSDKVNDTEPLAN